MIVYKGKEYARVSEILRPLNDFSAIPPEVLDRKAKIGTAVHQAIADDIMDEFPSPGSDGKPYFESYKKWRAQLLPKFLKSEERFFCDKTMLCGQIDNLVSFPLESGAFPFKSGIKLVDYKTSANESPTWSLQAHLYYYLLQENGVHVDPPFLFVKLAKSGSLPKVFAYCYSKHTMAKCMDLIAEFWSLRKKDSQKIST